MPWRCRIMKKQDSKPLWQNSHRESFCLHTPRDGSSSASDGARSGDRTSLTIAPPSLQSTWISGTLRALGGLSQDRENKCLWECNMAQNVLEHSGLFRAHALAPVRLCRLDSCHLCLGDFGKSLTLYHSQFSHLQNGDDINTHLNDFLWG